MHISIIKRFFSYVRMLNTRPWTSLRVLSTPYVHVGRKNAALEINPKPLININIA